jgi:hypothetical protein
MKNVLTILLSLTVVFAVAQNRVVDNPKPINHGPLACPSLVMTPVDNTVTLPSDLIEAILGTDVQSYTLINFAGRVGNPDASAGLFVGGTDAGLGVVDEGIVLCSGLISNAIGPNSGDGISTGNGLPGDADLTTFASQNTNDATVLEFSFVPNFDHLYIQFVFGSEEYNEYVYEYNDVFAFFLNGSNIAHVPSTNTPVSINTINLDLNTTYYKNNDYGDLYPGPYPYCNEMDGMTTVLVAEGDVNPDVANTIKLAIADGGDYALDSWVFIKGESFGGTDPEVPVSNWALFIGIGLILIFAVIRFRRLV